MRPKIAEFIRDRINESENESVSTKHLIKTFVEFWYEFDQQSPFTKFTHEEEIHPVRYTKDN